MGGVYSGQITRMLKPGYMIFPGFALIFVFFSSATFEVEVGDQPTSFDQRRLGMLERERVKGGYLWI